ncbi:tripartite tricarboxylate transporter substrate-binding protein [Roseicella aquatilis]|nr:tripartite tricarboxylate transporter substrate-binding protein [Roseicella aquatilis]
MNLDLRRRAMLGGLLMSGISVRGAAAGAVNRPVRIVNGFPPGGSSDTVARLYAEHMRGLYAPQIIVDNRSGAGGRLALEQVKAAEPDGTTIVHTPAGQLTIFPHIYTTLRYDPATDFIPVTTLVTYASTFVVAANHPARDLIEFGDWVRREGGEVSFGTPGAGTSTHFLGLQIGNALGIRMQHVPYRGISPALQDLLAGQIPCATAAVGEVRELQRAGQLRMLGISTPERLPSLPEVKTYAEQGFAGLTFQESFGLLLPARTPAGHVQQLYDAVRVAAEKPALRETLARLEYGIVNLAPADYAASLQADRDRWGPVIRATGFKAED